MIIYICDFCKNPTYESEQIDLYSLMPKWNNSLIMPNWNKCHVCSACREKIISFIKNNLITDDILTVSHRPRPKESKDQNQ